MAKGKRGSKKSVLSKAVKVMLEKPSVPMPTAPVPPGMPGMPSMPPMPQQQ